MVLVCDVRNVHRDNHLTLGHAYIESCLEMDRYSVTNIVKKEDLWSHRILIKEEKLF